ncbi:ribose 5-phosphate isomerase A [Paenibacillus sp. MMS20-IR301]|uniref:ribose 5-phosphate isomerase A n=1 Tax=Paenibacillus sp. MMS20-IR301 TaxID=2895946 RepID=UPI0028E6A607|nr:ribose 5-phosphate isomerase A [Paenibacillus sp. MMS20-IR301]WNS42434.1 ribose 5-phosphate isomerase A [Paenibacillus sp. MMS20-IR301]
MEDIRNNCAREALKYIEDQTLIGLGGGSTVACLIKHIAAAGRQVKVVTPSFTTASLCLQSGLPLLPLWSVPHISVAFDGCDEVDEQLHALKSGGGIHTREKLIASMADRYILLADESKLVKSLTFRHPVVLEVLEDALSYVRQAVIDLGGSPAARTSTAKDGYTVSDYGHPLLDVTFREVADIPALQRRLKGISGVIETSLFTEEVTDVLAAGPQGIRTLIKP